MLRLTLKTALTLLIFAAGAGTPALAELADELHAIQEEWARVSYQLPKAQKVAAFEKLAEQAAALREHYPARAESHAWEGIVLGSYAGARGGLGALSMARQARAALEKAESIDPDALDGSIHTSLGSLYYKVPGWPLGFGDDDQARAHLQRALAINPRGIDPNFFYGEFLLEEGQPARAVAALEKALAAPDRPGRASADAGRRAEARALLEKARREAAGS